MSKTSTFLQKPARLLWLIAASLLLLGLSQVLWIKKVWSEQKDGLRQETNYLFQRTVMILQDSLVARSASQSGLTMPRKRQPEGWNQRLDMADLMLRREPLHASGDLPTEVKTEFKFENPVPHPGDTSHLKTRQIQVFIATTDTQLVTIRRGLGRMILQVNQDSCPPPSNIVFDIRSDSVAPAELEAGYSAALELARLPRTFVLHSGVEPKFNLTGEIVTEPALAGLLRPVFYVAELRDYNDYLLKKMAPYGLFSAFLLGLTSLAFWLIFHNLKQQEKLSRQKNEFISNVTHELKTPLTTVGVALEALYDFEVLRNPEKTREYLHISKLELDRLNLLVEKVLRLSVFEQQGLNLRLEPVDLNQIVQQVADTMSLQARNMGASLHFSAAATPCTVMGDRLHLTGVVFNLIDNALKYRREHPEITVRLDTVERGAQTVAVLTVHDNGIGIPEEFQKQVFDKFFRVPAGDTHNVKGHGLGLHYVAHVIRQHRGSIRVDSQPGVESTFTVEIPLAEKPAAH